MTTQKSARLQLKHLRDLEMIQLTGEDRNGAASPRQPECCLNWLREDTTTRRGYFGGDR